MMTDKFGISLLHMPSDYPLPQLNGVFDAVELPGALLNSSLSVNKLPPLFYFNGLMPGELTRDIAVHSTRIQAYFLQQMAVLLESAGQLGAAGVVVNFGLESCFGDPARRRENIALIRRLTADLLRTGQTLLLPVRIPFMPEAGDSAEPYLCFLNELMCPNIGFVLSVHPHELAGREFKPAEMLHWLRFDTRMIHFVYEPETGNRLVSRLITPWTELRREFRLDLPCLVLPLMSRPETLEHELPILKDLFSTFNTTNTTGGV